MSDIGAPERIIRVEPEPVKVPQPVKVPVPVRVPERVGV